MKVLVMYYTATGNTKELAEHVAKGVQEVEGVGCVLKPAELVTEGDFISSDAVIAGSADHFGTMGSGLKAVFERFYELRSQMADKIGAAFVTAGDASGGKETTLMSILQAMLINGMIVVGDPLDATGHYGVACVGAPDEEAGANAIKLGQRVAQLAKKLNG